MDGVHALTDITGFGLAGHGLELARGAKLKMQIDLASIPLLPGVLELAEAGVVTGASGRNWDAFGTEVTLPAHITFGQQALLSDPQTSGGLLVSCAPECEADVLACFARHGFADARTIGRMAAGSGVEVI
jgi:selenide,water dikinase